MGRWLRVWLLVLLLLGAAETAQATCSNVPFSFSPGTTIFSGQVNSDFTAVVNCLNNGSITRVGTIATGVWNGSPIGVAYGGSGQTTFNSSLVLYGVFSQDANFTWDATNHRLGVQQGSPLYAIDIGGSGDMNVNAGTYRIAGTAIISYNAGQPIIAITSGASTIATFSNSAGAGAALSALNTNTGVSCSLANASQALSCTGPGTFGGTLNVTAFQVGGVSGVDCSGVTAGTVVVNKGLVTHC